MFSLHLCCCVTGVTFSRDGLHWEETRSGCVIHTADTCTNIIWSAARQRYLATTRLDTPSAAVTRTVIISESEDFVSWTPLGTLGHDALDRPW